MYDQLPTQNSIDTAIDGLTSRNFETYFLQNKIEALAMIKTLIPDGAEVMTGSSTTLEQIGFIDLLKSGNHPWRNLKDAIVAEQDKEKQAALRAQSVHATYWLGSVHAITEAGETITASASGSQLPAYSFTSNNVIWVAGAHKIVKDLDDGLKRIREYTLPLEDARMKKTGAPGSSINKLLIFERETMPWRKIHMILVNKVLGF